MQSQKYLWTLAIGTLVWLAPATSSRADFILGEPPVAPTDVSDLPRRGPSPRGVTGGFSVDVNSREEVRSFYNAVYLSSDGVAMNSTANAATCSPGTNGTAFKEAVLRRINWYRAMAGIPAAVSFDAGNNAKDQEMAVMMSRNNMIGHFPTPAWVCFSANGANAASNSNLALGSAGADSVSGYIQDPGVNNSAAGHRRWLLYPQTQVMGTGDVPDTATYSAANAVWVRDGHYFDPRPATRTPYVAWPPPGYVPYPVVFPRWSFAYPNANFTNATITMRSNGVSIAVNKHAVIPNVGENTVVWVPLGLNPDNYSTVFPFGGADAVYSIAISNILVGAQNTNFTYTVTVFDPDLPGADFFPPTVNGPSQATVGVGNAYTCNAISKATSYQWRATLRAPYSLNDGAEAGLVNFSTNTTAGYAVRTSTYRDSGSWAFRLAHPDSPAEESLTLNGTLLPRTNTILTFRSRLTWATSDEFAKVQVSTNAGRTWLEVYNQTGSSSPGEGSFNTRTVQLTHFAGNSLLLRFNYIATGSFYSPMEAGDGWFIDNIVLTNTDIASLVVTNTTATTNFTFNPSQAGTFSLDARALIFTEFPLDWGPAKQVTAVAGAPVIRLSQPLLTNNQVWINFSVQSGSAATFKLLQADQPQGAWTTNAAATLTTITPGVSYRYTTVPAGAAKFYRIQTP